MAWDRLFLAGEYLALAATLCVLAFRFTVTIRRRRQGEIVVRPEAWMTWGVYLVIALFAVFHVPATRHFLSVTIGEWFEPIPYITIPLGGYVLWTRVCYRLEPRFKPRWDWPVYGAILTLAACILTLQAAGIGRLPSSPGFYRDTLVSALFSVMLLFIALRIVLPTFASSRRQEKQPPMRVRLRLMTWTQAAVALMTVNEIGSALARLAGFPYDPGPVRVGGAALFVITLLAAYFPPARYYVWLVQRLERLGSLASVAYLHAIEAQIARHIDPDVARLSFLETLQAPDLAVYQSVIRILDARKLVNRCPLTPERLKVELDSAAHPDYDYEEVLGKLREIGKAYVLTALPKLIRAHVSTL